MRRETLSSLGKEDIDIWKLGGWQWQGFAIVITFLHRTVIFIRLIDSALLVIKETFKMDPYLTFKRNSWFSQVSPWNSSNIMIFQLWHKNKKSVPDFYCSPQSEFSEWDQKYTKYAGKKNKEGIRKYMISLCLFYYLKVFQLCARYRKMKDAFSPVTCRIRARQINFK